MTHKFQVGEKLHFHPKGEPGFIAHAPIAKLIEKDGQPAYEVEIPREYWEEEEKAEYYTVLEEHTMTEQEAFMLQLVTPSLSNYVVPKIFRTEN